MSVKLFTSRKHDVSSKSAREKSAYADLFSGGTAVSPAHLEENLNPSNAEAAKTNSKEWETLFPTGPLGSPFQDGHYVYQVVAGSGHGSRAKAPILYVADIENPSKIHAILQP